MKIHKRIIQCVGNGLFIGGGLGFLFGWTLYLYSQVKAAEIKLDHAEFYSCDSGMAPFGLALFGAILGGLVGLVVGDSIVILHKAEPSSSDQFTPEK